MSVGYKAVQWTHSKKVYDVVIVAGVLLYLATFIIVGKIAWRGDRAISDEILLIRALGTCAIVMLHIVLAIGPLARFFPRLSPLLYNRRHLGVATFLVAAAHGTIVLGYYHGFGRLNPFVSLLTHDADFGVASSLPFQLFGAMALVILFIMAATSHDFWLRNLSARTWKSIHMMVYACYVLVIAHVMFGALQAERSSLYPALLAAGVIGVTALHVAAGLRERRIDKQPWAAIDQDKKGAWIDLGDCRDIPNSRARTVCVDGRPRIAVFRNGDDLCAVQSVCAHQGGPLAEGKIIDGCITCPWHGWQYRPEDGRSPPPFEERISTHRIRSRDGRLELNALPEPPGTAVPPARLPEEMT